MNPEESKFLLSSLRPSDANSSDPEIAKAFEQMANDPELQAWFDAQHRFDETVSEKLNEISPPEDLKDTLLAGVRVSQKKRQWRTSTALACAALIGILLLSVILFRPINGDSTMAEYRTDMIQSLEQLTHIELPTGTAEEIRSYLNAEGQLPHFALPASWADRELGGCRILNWEGNQVSLICFRDKSGSEPPIHLLVLDASALKHTSISAAPTSVADGDWSTVYWKQGEKIYLLATQKKDLKLEDKILSDWTVS